MEAIGEAVENGGLAQEIQNGLAKSMQKPPKFGEWKDEIEAMKAKLEGMDPMDIYKTPLGGRVIRKWAALNGYDLSQARRKSQAGADAIATNPPSEGGIKANWDEFKAGPAWETLAKYEVWQPKLAKECEKPVPAMFAEMRALGKGAFGAVFLTFKKDSGAAFAVKKMVKTIAKKNNMIKDVLIEREVLSKMSTPFAVGLHYAWQTDNDIGLVLTLCPGGDLHFVLQQHYSEGKDKKFKGLPAGAIQFYAASMALGLDAIHKAGYVYRDLKPMNVLLDAEGKVMISDMGLTAFVKDKAIKQCSGTRGYWSPETIKKEAYQFEPDWWSLGITMYVLWSDRLPFKGKDEEKDAMTCAGEIAYSHDEPADLQAVINKLCKVNMSERLCCKDGAAELKGDPYFKDLDWARLELGVLKAPYEPNINDINAPSKSDIDGFKKPKDVEWVDEDKAKFKDWEFFNQDLWYDEAIKRMESRRELGGSGGGGGCCVLL